jgi:hypothetical protein
MFQLKFVEKNGTHTVCPIHFSLCLTVFKMQVALCVRCRTNEELPVVAKANQCTGPVQKKKKKKRKGLIEVRIC